ncbi:2OG-Fe(II) oxygenase [Planctobacterium marinum]|uniref:Prolyl 4-hydroxylase subunit alpha n=1 Tax=Planctobacterium marinum TaxID=1631968 RepID=A0AA48HWI2_9ALTE|nr:prolyl 4-hydroxylase subunit alpha [Planctobacterium marinum]
MSAAFEISFNASEANQELFEQIAQQLTTKGFSINPFALPVPLTSCLHEQVCAMQKAAFEVAGIGRDDAHNLNRFVRRDEISWISGKTTAEQMWLQWAGALQTYLNRRLYLGLFSFESHFAIYGENDFYKRHVDAFKGDSNRILSLVVYLNPNWTNEDGGELVLYSNENDVEGVKVIPGLGTVVAFLSEDFPHEVLPAKRERISIAGWFRVNGSHHDRVDPPR